MQKQQPTPLAALLRSQVTEQSLIHFLQYTDAKLLTIFPSKKELRSLGQSLKTRTSEVIQSTLKMLVNKFSKVFLLYNHQQLMLLLSLCLCCNPTKDIIEVSLKYVQQMIETAHLLAFRSVRDVFQLELYGLLVYFSGMLNILSGPTLQNGLFPKVLKIIANINKQSGSFIGVRVLTQLLLVVCFMNKLNEESRRMFGESLKKMTKGKPKENLYNIALSTANERVLEFSKIVIFRLADDVLEKADLSVNMKKREMVLLPSNKKCWPAWVEQAYRSSTPHPPPIQPIFQSIKAVEVYQLLQNLELWANSPRVSDPSSVIRQQAIDMLVRYLENKMFGESKYTFRMNLWKSKCKSIQEMSTKLRDKEKQLIRQDILSSF